MDTSLPANPATEPAPIETHRIINGRSWRVSDPSLPPDVRQTLVNVLMDARRAVKAALGAKDVAAERRARTRVHLAKVALGERGLRWWDIENQSNARIEERSKALMRSLGTAYPLTAEQARLLAVGEAETMRLPYRARPQRGHAADLAIRYGAL